MDMKKLPVLVEGHPSMVANKSLSMTESLSAGLRIADERLSQAATPDETLLATRIRAEVLRQNLDVERYFLNLRQLEERAVIKRRQQIFDAGLRLGALITGVTLAVLGNSWLGGFVMAAGLYSIARDFVLDKFPSPSARNKRHHNE
jgi:hypothetical protein